MTRPSPPPTLAAPLSLLVLLAAAVTTPAHARFVSTYDVTPCAVESLSRADKALVCYYEGRLSVYKMDPCLCTHIVFKDAAVLNQDAELKIVSDVSGAQLMRARSPSLRAVLGVKLSGAGGATALTSPGRRLDVARAIARRVDAEHLDGVHLTVDDDLDLDMPAAAARKAIVGLLKALRSALDAHGREKRHYLVSESIADDFTTREYEPTWSDGSSRKSRRRATSTTTTTTSAPEETPDEAAARYLELERDSQNAQLLISLPPRPEQLAKRYDVRNISRYVDYMVMQTQLMTDATELGVTYHPSRLMGLDDMLNADSVLDLASSLGAPSSQLVLTLPGWASSFELADRKLNAPRAPARGPPASISQPELCKLLSRGNWTLERDEDLTAPYAYSARHWIAFDDELSSTIKGKYAVVRGLGGAAVSPVDALDWAGSCGQPAPQLHALHGALSQLRRTSRGALLASLSEDLHQTGALTFAAGEVRLSEYRITRVVDTDGTVHVVRKDVQTHFQCSRQGYYAHPLGCNKFYRCVKFNQYASDFTVFEYDCPAGLAFDERWEVCVWPGSLPRGAPCSGSSEIAPVPRARYSCPRVEGYYADPENCRWFFACLDHARDGASPLTAYEFRCPFGLVFDEARLLCDWPWKVDGCGRTGAALLVGVGSRLVYEQADLEAGRHIAPYASLPDYHVSGGRILGQGHGVVLGAAVGLQGVAAADSLAANAAARQAAANQAANAAAINQAAYNAAAANQAAAHQAAYNAAAANQAAAAQQAAYNAASQQAALNAGARQAAIDQAAANRAAYNSATLNQAAYNAAAANQAAANAAASRQAAYNAAAINQAAIDEAAARQAAYNAAAVRQSALNEAAARQSAANEAAARQAAYNAAAVNQAAAQQAAINEAAARQAAYNEAGARQTAYNAAAINQAAAQQAAINEAGARQAAYNAAAANQAAVQQAAINEAAARQAAINEASARQAAYNAAAANQAAAQQAAANQAAAQQAAFNEAAARQAAANQAAALNIVTTKNAAVLPVVQQVPTAAYTLPATTVYGSRLSIATAAPAVPVATAAPALAVQPISTYSVVTPAPYNAAAINSAAAHQAAVNDAAARQAAANAAAVNEAASRQAAYNAASAQAAANRQAAYNAAAANRAAAEQAAAVNKAELARQAAAEADRAAAARQQAAFEAYAIQQAAANRAAYDAAAAARQSAAAQEAASRQAAAEQAAAYEEASARQAAAQQASIAARLPVVQQVPTAAYTLPASTIYGSRFAVSTAAPAVAVQPVSSYSVVTPAPGVRARPIQRIQPSLAVTPAAVPVDTLQPFSVATPATVLRSRPLQTLAPVTPAPTFYAQSTPAQSYYVQTSAPVLRARPIQRVQPTIAVTPAPTFVSQPALTDTYSVVTSAPVLRTRPVQRIQPVVVSTPAPTVVVQQPAVETYTVRPAPRARPLPVVQSVDYSAGDLEVQSVPQYRLRPVQRVRPVTSAPTFQDVVGITPRPRVRVQTLSTAAPTFQAEAPELFQRVRPLTTAVPAFQQVQPVQTYTTAAPVVQQQVFSVQPEVRVRPQVRVQGYTTAVPSYQEATVRVRPAQRVQFTSTVAPAFQEATFRTRPVQRVYLTSTEAPAFREVMPVTTAPANPLLVAAGRGYSTTSLPSTSRPLFTSSRAYSTTTEGYSSTASGFGARTQNLGSSDETVRALLDQFSGRGSLLAAKDEFIGRTIAGLAAASRQQGGSARGRVISTTPAALSTSPTPTPGGVVRAGSLAPDTPVVVVSRLSDANPLLVSKLGAQCVCAQPQVILRGPGRFSTASPVGYSSPSSTTALPEARIVTSSTPLPAPSDLSAAYGAPDGSPLEQLRSTDEGLQAAIDCQRPGLFRHPHRCDKFYACHWDQWKNRYTLHVFSCPVHLAYDKSIGACNYPSRGPACANNNLLV